MSAPDLPADIVAALAEAGRRAKTARLLSASAAPALRRTLFRIDTESGGTVKARRMECEAVAREHHALRALLPATFAPVLGRSGAVIIEEWVEGDSLADAEPSEPFVTEAGRALAALHTMSMAGGLALPFRASTAARTRTTLGRLDWLAEVGALGAGVAADLARLVVAQDPGEARFGLVHLDFCGENMVVDGAGRLRVVDNERLSVAELAEDVWRTWYRWGLRGRSWREFQDAYLAGGGSDDVFESATYWCVAGVVASAVFRVRLALPGRDVPLACLAQLASACVACQEEMST